MRVDNPRFLLRVSSGPGQVVCSDCPLQPLGVAVCKDWISSHRPNLNSQGQCPTSTTYAEACEWAAREGK